MLIVCEDICQFNAAGLLITGVRRREIGYLYVTHSEIFPPLAVFEVYSGEKNAVVAVIKSGGNIYLAQRAPPGPLRGEKEWRGYILYECRKGCEIDDYPAPPLPIRRFDKVFFTRFISIRRRMSIQGGEIIWIPHGADVMNFAYYRNPVATFLAIRYRPECRPKGQYLPSCVFDLPFRDIQNDDPRFPGSGKLTGEEFRVVEPDADYLRLIDRGGDEHLAWDFVLGTLDSGEWIIMADDGLYVAKRDGDRVVVASPYYGSLIDVRGPPTAYKYPVVPTRTFKHAELYGANVTYDATLLKWPLNAQRGGEFKPELGAPMYLNLDYCLCLKCKTYRLARYFNS
ncbi:hypothetical protein [Pyrobaculum aerophilum]|nr:hypothetical protein [Pyrobaculum aerophilum]